MPHSRARSVGLGRRHSGKIARFRTYTGPCIGRRRMENIEQRVKKIVAEQLGVNEAEIKNESS
ncbi:MAG: hypothetical protein ABI920_15395, partial [Casimicrobiaceae bacterium]